MKPKILLLDEPHPKARAIMKEVAECDLYMGENIYQNLVLDNTFDGVFTTLHKIDEILLKRLPEVKFVACPCTGTDHIKVPDGVKLIHLDDEWKRTEGLKVTSTAEHTIGLLLRLTKQVKKQLWMKHIGIIGYGRIGQMVDHYAEAFGMIVHETDKNSGYPLDKMLPLCDIVSIHIPLKDNEKYIGENHFSLMKKNTLLINTSRQGIVDIDALIPRLINKDIYYADDFKDDIDLTKYGAIQTCHVSGNSLEAREMTDCFIAMKIVQYVKEYISGNS